MHTAAVVFAAGASTRMGGANKMLLVLDGETLVGRAVGRAEAAGLSPVIVVVGHQERELRDALHGRDVIFARNAAYRGPMSASMHAAIEATPPDVDALVVVLGDMAHVTSDMLRAMAATAEATGAPLVASRYGDVVAPPILFRRALFSELLAWHGEGCGKPVVRAHAADAAYCDWPAGRLADVDTANDWLALRASLDNSTS